MKFHARIVLFPLLLVLATGCGERVTDDVSTTADVVEPQVDRREKLFESALALIENDSTPERDVQNSLASIRRLAMGRPPYLPAQRYLVDRMLDEGYQSGTVQQQRILIENLTIVADAGDESAQAVLGLMHLARKDLAAAIERLRPAVHDQPGLLLTFARTLLLDGQSDEAVEVGNQAVQHYRQQLSDSKSNESATIGLAQAYTLLERYDEALAALDALELEGGPTISTTRTNIKLAQIRHWHRVNPEDPRVATSLRTMFDQEPGSLLIWSNVYELSLGDWVQASELKRWVKDAIITHSSGGTVELIRAAHMHSQGKVGDAIELLEDVLENEVELERPEILNNLASYLANAEPPELERALAHADRLIELAPQNLMYRETRGQVLAKLGRVEEAITELEAARTVMANYEPLLETLASLYDDQQEYAKADAVRNGLKNKLLGLEIDPDTDTLIGELMKR
ncbi:Anaphase-promoting complex, cyclosome, subunit 3 [Rubripirellula amarantea]|uniref:Anaphase-promoting complex, cyclosome, subunit 3 n=1 Tax=Rubripirellula amarantea TaxID=2527999 RepID=A0A5C5WED4_9BACT|nr:tetratricopeptide repeat protein [Rubripirellula amarantea]TWT48092.1 Anaphase-promoting complex, cyclosome, subunit 3 [Rubripirellula amarantea]